MSTNAPHCILREPCRHATDPTACTRPSSLCTESNEAIDNLAAQSMLSDAAEWKEPQKVIEDMPWLVFVLADRVASRKAGA